MVNLRPVTWFYLTNADPKRAMPGHFQDRGCAARRRGRGSARGPGPRKALSKDFAVKRAKDTVRGISEMPLESIRTKAAGAPVGAGGERLANSSS